MVEKKQKKLTVKEIKTLEPKAEVYELSPRSRYLVTIRQSELDIGGQVANTQAQTILKLMQMAGVPTICLITKDDNIKFMEIQVE